jgi:hypothetical protein
MFGTTIAEMVDRALAEGAVRLTLIDPGRRMRKYYRLGVQPNLFGGLDLVREWGPIPGGRRPPRIVEEYPDLPSLLARLGEQVKVRLNGGYSVLA